MYCNTDTKYSTKNMQMENIEEKSLIAVSSMESSAVCDNLIKKQHYLGN